MTIAVKTLIGGEYKSMFESFFFPIEHTQLLF